MLKCEEFPDLPVVLELAFGESDRIKRGGSSLESHPRLTDTVLYMQQIAKKYARETVLALAPKGSFNYTQNYREGIHQA